MAVILTNGQVLTSDWAPLYELVSLQKPQNGTTFISVSILTKRLADLQTQWLEACAGDMQRVTLDLGALFIDLEELCEVETRK